MIKAFLLIALCFLQETKAQERLISLEDQLHFLACSSTTSLTYAIVYNKTKNKNKALLWGIGTGVAVGVLKEVYDSTQPHNKFGMRDLGSDIIGSLTAAVIIKIF